MCIDIYDEVGIGGGASGMAGGLLHPYSHKVKLLWLGAECWSESLKLLVIAEATLASKELDSETPDLTETSNRFICRRRGILRPAISLKHLNILTDNAQKSLPCCKIESLDRDAAQSLVASLCVPLNLAFYMPEAINVHPQRYRKVSLVTLAEKNERLIVPGYTHMHRAQPVLLLHLLLAYVEQVLEDGKLTLKTQTTKPPQPSVFVSWSPDNTMLRTCGNVEVLKLWDVESGTIDMDLITTGVSASERMRRENLLSATRNVIMEKLQIGGPSLGLVEVH